MKLNVTGFLFELDQIPFKVGSVLQVAATLPYTKEVIVDRVRTIKHYDRYFRRPPKMDKLGQIIDTNAVPKKLIEAHFVQLKAENRMAIERYLMAVSVERMKYQR